MIGDIIRWTIVGAMIVVVIVYIVALWVKDEGKE
jgi:hypothetical protein